MESGDKTNNNIIQSPLFETVRNYLTGTNQKNDHIYIFVPYIKTAVLQDLIEGLNSTIIIVTTWKLEDLLTGSSELELYPFCKEKGITLYINNRIHLKIYSSGFNDLILASANISNRGLGTIPKYNFECATLIKNLTNIDRLYFAKIQKNSVHVDNELYEELVKWYDKQEKRPPIKDELEKLIPIERKENFLIGTLPMTKSVELLEESYQRISEGFSASDDKEIRDCVFHDLANYNIEPGLSKEEFRKKLKKEFFNHPFIIKIDEFINSEAYFGRIKEWVQNNCTNVPVPSRRELTGNVQVLLDWFEKLGDGKYSIDVPGEHSQRIRKVKS